MITSQTLTFLSKILPLQKGGRDLQMHFALAALMVLAPLSAAAQAAGSASPYSLDQTLNLQMNPSAPAATAPVLSVAPASVPAPAQPVALPQSADYAANQASDVFGAHLFTGNFARQGPAQFNPDYAISPGDNVQIRLWGAFEYDAPVPVDPRGNIFLPHVGPVQLLGVLNKDIQRVVEAAVGKVFRSNVNSYASLAAAQPVRVYVSGYVNRPGLYEGTSMDSLLHYLDQAGGIDPERGSFLNVQVKRGEQTRITVSLYDFLLEGRMPLVQLADGDVIFVSSRQSTLKVSGLAENTRRFEFTDASRTVADLIKMAKPRAQATHVRIVRNSGAVRNTEYYPLTDATQVALQNGDELEFTADKKTGSITVRVEGEHQSAQEYVLSNGARLGDLIRQVQFSDRSDTDSIQLYRVSVKERQKQNLQTSLRSLESAALTARSATSEEARLRVDEAGLILQWVERAKKIDPSGQVLIAQNSARNDMLLENGDIVRIPAKDGLVLVSGEVLFPNAIAYDGGMDVEDYLDRAGGYTQNADASRIVIAHRDGSFAPGSGAVRAGDEIMVLPKIDVKSMQVWKEITQIVYQIAVSAKIVFGL